MKLLTVNGVYPQTVSKERIGHYVHFRNSIWLILAYHEVKGLFKLQHFMDETKTAIVKWNKLK